MDFAAEALLPWNTEAEIWGRVWAVITRLRLLPLGKARLPPAASGIQWPV